MKPGPGGQYLRKIISGGQTGVDQAALAIAIALNIPHGGWCPRGRRCETGAIPNQYHLKEMTSSDYAARTRQNVCDSDGTLILFRKCLTGGTHLTQQFAFELDRPLFLVDLQGPVPCDQLRAWIYQHGIGVLNIAGPRQSSAPGIFDQAKEVLEKLLANISTPGP